MKKINNKGFTLIEVLAVLVILVAIMGIAIPTITSSMERTKEKQNNAKKEMLASYAEEYVEDHKNEIYKNLGSYTSCYIPIAALKNSGYLAEDAELDIDGNSIEGYVRFNSNDNLYEYKESIEYKNGNPDGELCKTYSGISLYQQLYANKELYYQINVYADYEIDTATGKFKLLGNPKKFDIRYEDLSDWLAKGISPYTCAGFDNAESNECTEMIKFTNIVWAQEFGNSKIEYKKYTLN